PNGRIEILESSNFGISFNKIFDVQAASNSVVYLPSIAAGDGSVWVAYGQQSPTAFANFNAPNIAVVGFSDTGLNVPVAQQTSTTLSDPSFHGGGGAPSVAIDTKNHKVAVAFETSIVGDSSSPFLTPYTIDVAVANNINGFATFGTPTVVTATQ